MNTTEQMEMYKTIKGVIDDIVHLIEIGTAAKIEQVELYNHISTKMAAALEIPALKAANLVRLGIHEMAKKYGLESPYSNSDLRRIIELAV